MFVKDIMILKTLIQTYLNNTKYKIYKILKIIKIEMIKEL